jgi:hypothetical protein
LTGVCPQGRGCWERTDRYQHQNWEPSWIIAEWAAAIWRAGVTMRVTRYR